jgi:uncharacterized protein (TIGR02231 family)
MRRASLFLLLAVLVAPRPARAGGDDYKAEAESIMGLSFDLDSVQGRLKQRAAKAPSPAPPAAYYAGDEGGYYEPPPPAPPALPLEPNSKVDQVVVFRDRALVTRYRDVHVPAGSSTITFEGLPFGIAADSLYAQVRKGDLKIVGVELESGATKVEETDRIAEVRTEMITMTDTLGQIRDRVESLLAQRTFLRSAVTATGDRQMPTLDQIKGTLGYVGDTERDIAAKLRKEQDAAAELDKKLQPLLIKLDNPQATGMTVRLDVESTDGRDVELGLRYQVFGARWWPSYNARLEESSHHVTIEYYGLVSQTTAEDWTDASLLLSTADPSVSGDLPTLESWYLGREAYYGGYDQGVAMQLQGGTGVATETATTSTPTGGGGLVGSQMTASVQGSGAVVFAIPGKRTVSGNGSEQRLPVGNQTFATDLEFATVPKVVPEVYRKAKLKYAGSIPLLPGSVASFVGADYVGAGNINAVVPGEDLELAFGTDDSFKVERTLVSRQQEFLGAGKKTVRYTFHFKIRVQNFGKTAETVLVSDQMPVSEIERVTVERLEPTTKPLDPLQDDPAGVMKWSLVVPPGGSQDIELSFSVTAPREVPLQALEEMF